MLIATIPIPNKALDLLLVMRYFIGYLLSNKQQGLLDYNLDFFVLKKTSNPKSIIF